MNVGKTKSLQQTHITSISSSFFHYILPYYLNVTHLSTHAHFNAATRGKESVDHNSSAVSAPFSILHFMQQPLNSMAYKFPIKALAYHSKLRPRNALQDLVIPATHQKALSAFPPPIALGDLPLVQPASPPSDSACCTKDPWYP